MQWTDESDWLTQKRQAGVRFALAGKNKLTAQPWSALSDADRVFLREHRETIKSLVRAGLPPLPVAPPVQPPPQPEPSGMTTSVISVDEGEPSGSTSDCPVLFAYGIRITESHVRQALKGFHDDALSDYLDGRTSKREAYRIAQNWVRQVIELGGRA